MKARGPRQFFFYPGKLARVVRESCVQGVGYAGKMAQDLEVPRVLALIRETAAEYKRPFNIELRIAPPLITLSNSVFADDEAPEHELVLDVLLAHRGMARGAVYSLMQVSAPDWPEGFSTVRDFKTWGAMIAEFELRLPRFLLGDSEAFK